MSAPPTTPQQDEFAAAERMATAEWFIVMNSASGKLAFDERKAAIEDALRAAGRRFRFVPCGAGGLLVACQLGAQWAAEQGGVLAAAGGDGTINCAATAALQHGCPLAVIPHGTFNLFAREYGIPLDTEAAMQALLRARPRPVQVGLINQKPFLANAAVGLYPKLLEDREEMKEQLGLRRRWVAVLSSLKSLLEWQSDLTLDAEIDGDLVRLRTPSLFVCNNRQQLQRVGIAEGLVSQVGEGQLAALLSHPMGFWGKLRLVWDAAFGQLRESNELDSFAVRSLDLTTRHARKLKVATDGEVQWMQLPLRFAVSPKPLMMLVPLPEDRVAAS